MSIRSYTKTMFADTLQEMAREMPFEKIRIKDLCARCGADRHTFYYHFRDKYDLTAWIFSRDYSQAIISAGDGYPVEHAVKMLEVLLEKRTFYRNAFSDRSQNAISEYIYEYFVKLGSDAVAEKYGRDALTKETVYIIKSHSFACLGHTIEWLNGKTGYTPAEFAALQYKFMPEILLKAYGITLNSESASR